MNLNFSRVRVKLAKMFGKFEFFPVHLNSENESPRNYYLEFQDVKESIQLLRIKKVVH